LWDPASKSYKEQNGALCSCRKADGTLYTEICGSKISNTVTCPSSDVWQNILTSIVKRLQTELQVNGVYIDQICAGQGVPCFAKNHNHSLGGGEFWQASYRKLLNKIRAQTDRDNVLTSEENAECFLDLFDVLLIVNTPQKSGRIVPLFPIVYSDRVLYCGFQYFSEPVNSLDFILKNVYALLWGSQLGWIEPYRIMSPEADKEASFLKEMVNFRSKQHDIFYGGRFIKEYIPSGDNPALYPTSMPLTPAVRGAQWKTADGKSILLLVNMDSRQHTIVLPNGNLFRVSPCQCERIEL
jgi:hypothetical protein